MRLSYSAALPPVRVKSQIGPVNLPFVARMQRRASRFAILILSPLKREQR
jgi:hypothetical protein